MSSILKMKKKYVQSLRTTGKSNKSESQFLYPELSDLCKKFNP